MFTVGPWTRASHPQMQALRLPAAVLRCGRNPRQFLRHQSLGSANRRFASTKTLPLVGLDRTLRGTHKHLHTLLSSVFLFLFLGFLSTTPTLPFKAPKYKPKRAGTKLTVHTAFHWKLPEGLEHHTQQMFVERTNKE